MFKLLVIVVMLMLFPFQWSAAQGHEIRDDAGAFAVAVAATDTDTAVDTAANITQRLVHTDEPGGICQFHELSQPSALVPAHDADDLLARAGEAWSAARQNHPPRSHAPSDIEKPKWSSRPHPAATT